MKKVLFFTVALSLIATAAMAHDVTGRMGLGFVSTDAPVGLRYWVNEKIGIDGGIGFSSQDLGEETATSFVLNAGVPFIFNAAGDRVNFLIRPGLKYSSFETYSQIELSGALEFEVFVTDDFSVSAAHGIAIDMTNPDDENLDSTTDFGLFGNNWTSFGFHYYLKNK
jgi:hypothetical protein